MRTKRKSMFKDVIRFYMKQSLFLLFIYKIEAVIEAPKWVKYPGDSNEYCAIYGNVCINSFSYLHTQNSDPGCTSAFSYNIAHETTPLSLSISRFVEPKDKSK
jgi:hypothetical protein